MPKGVILKAYELRNVRIGLQAGLQGKAQIRSYYYNQDSSPISNR
jgi:malate synthase